VLDTSAVIQLIERRDAALVAELRKASEPPAISAVTLGELAVGWSELDHNSPRHRTYAAARRLRVVNIVADSFAQGPSGLIRCFGECRAAGIKGTDAWIAATASATESTLITYDATLATRYAVIGSSTLLPA
jgi:predicted nucleic acid-binding protein